MSLPDNERRCIGIGTDRGEPNADCLDCERRTEGIADYMAGRKVWWMAPPTEQPCPRQLERRK